MQIDSRILLHKTVIRIVSLDDGFSFGTANRKWRRTRLHFLFGNEKRNEK